MAAAAASHDESSYRNSFHNGGARCMLEKCQAAICYSRQEKCSRPACKQRPKGEQTATWVEVKTSCNQGCYLPSNGLPLLSRIAKCVAELNPLAVRKRLLRCYCRQ